MRKRLLSFTLLLLAGLTAAQAQNYDFSATAPTGQTLYYAIDSVTNTVSVTFPSIDWVGYIRPTGNLTLPDSVNNGGITYSVTSIDFSAFGQCVGLTSVTIPNSVTTIERGAFASCTVLVSVAIPNTVTSIGDYAFDNCPRLSLLIPDSVTTIGNNAFRSVRYIEYHGGATGAPWGARVMNGYVDSGFVYLDSTKTTLLVYIGSDSVVTISNTVDTISSSAFSFCTDITSVTIPNSVTLIGSGAFSECTSLVSVALSNSVDKISNTVFYNCTSLESIVIPNSVTTIEWAAFYQCTALTSIVIPSSVNKIEYLAFGNCTGLRSVTIPNTVDTIEDQAFNEVRHVIYYGNATGGPWGAWRMNGYIENGLVYSDSLRTNVIAYIGDGDSVTIANTATTIERYAFHDCNWLTSVTIPNSVTTIEECAFRGSGLFSVRIPDSVTTIELFTFNGCTNLISVKIPNSVTSIGQWAFAYCTSLMSVTIPSSVSSIGAQAFAGTSLTSVTIPNSVTSISSGAFGSCDALTRVCYEADSCLYMHQSVFSYDTNITQLVIGENVRWIPDNTFAYFGRRGASPSNPGVPIIMSPSIVSKSMDAPRLGTNAFTGIADTATVYIPCGSRASYESRWSYFSNFVEIPMDTLFVETADAVMGMAEVLEEPTCANGSSATIAATANYGYHFVAWNDGDTANPRTIVVTSDTVLTALFERNEYMLTVLCNEAQGTVTGAGTYLFGDTAHVEAVANEGFVFSHWDETGSTESALDTMMNGDVVLTAIFVETEGIETVGESRVTLYPNPTTGLLLIDGEEVQRVEVYDLGGCVVMRSEQTKSLDLGQLSAGVYYVKVTSQQGVTVIKAVKK